MKRSTLDERLAAWLKGHGYRYAGGKIYSLPVAWLSESLFTPHRFRSLFAAAEYMIPIVKDSQGFKAACEGSGRDFATKTGPKSARRVAGAVS